jgi:hypothetical protein
VLAGTLSKAARAGAGTAKGRGAPLHLADRYTCRWRVVDYVGGCVHWQREDYAPQSPGAARGPQKLPSPLTESTSVLGSRVKVIGAAGV